MNPPSTSERKAEVWKRGLKMIEATRRSFQSILVTFCSTILLPLILTLGLPIGAPVRAVSGSSISGSTYTTSRNRDSNNGANAGGRQRSATYRNLYSPTPSFERNHRIVRQAYSSTATTVGGSVFIDFSHNRKVSAMIFYSFITLWLLQATGANKMLLSRILGRLGFRSSSFYRCVVLLFLSPQEKVNLLSSLNRIADQYSSRSQRRSNYDDEIENDEALINMVEEVSVALKRRMNAVVGGVLQHGRERISSNHMQDLYHREGISERAKFEEDVRLTKKGTAIKASEKIVNSKDNGEPPSSSYVVLTILLSAKGPVLRNPAFQFVDRENRVVKPFSLSSFLGITKKHQANQKNYLTLARLKKFINTLPPYLRKLSRLKDIQRMKSLDDWDGNSGSNEAEEIGFDVNVLWTPSNLDDSITDLDVKTTFPDIVML